MDNKTSDRKEDKLRVDILADAFDAYRTMAMVFFDRLPKEERVEAMLEAIKLIKEDK